MNQLTSVSVRQQGTHKSRAWRLCHESLTSASLRNATCISVPTVISYDNVNPPLLAPAHAIMAPRTVASRKRPARESLPPNAKNDSTTVAKSKKRARHEAQADHVASKPARTDTSKQIISSTSSRKRPKKSQAPQKQRTVNTEPHRPQPTSVSLPVINDAPTAVLTILPFGNGEGSELGLGSNVTEALRPRVNNLLDGRLEPSGIDASPRAGGILSSRHQVCAGCCRG